MQAMKYSTPRLRGRLRWMAAELISWPAVGWHAGVRQVSATWAGLVAASASFFECIT